MPLILWYTFILFAIKKRIKVLPINSEQAITCPDFRDVTAEETCLWEWTKSGEVREQPLKRLTSGWHVLWTEDAESAAVSQSRGTRAAQNRGTHSKRSRRIGRKGRKGRRKKAACASSLFPVGPRTDEGLFEQGGVQMNLLFRMLLLAATCRKSERGDGGRKAGKGLWS